MVRCGNNSVACVNADCWMTKTGVRDTDPYYKCELSFGNTLNMCVINIDFVKITVRTNPTCSGVSGIEEWNGLSQCL